MKTSSVWKVDSNIYHTTEKALGIVYKYKLLTEVIAEEMYDYLEQDKLLLKEEKWCRRGSGETKDQLLTDKTVLKDSKKIHTNLFMAWIDCKKVYDFVPHS